jgi:hypothetical protein
VDAIKIGGIDSRVFNLGTKVGIGQICASAALTPVPIKYHVVWTPESVQILGEEINPLPATKRVTIPRHGNCTDCAMAVKNGIKYVTSKMFHG